MDPISIRNQMGALNGYGQLGQASLGKTNPEFSVEGAGQALSPAEGVDEPNFKDMLTESIEKVNTLMNTSDAMIDDLASGKSANIHGTLIALQKADISFRMLLEVRNKVMKAYEEVMRMQV